MRKSQPLVVLAFALIAASCSTMTSGTAATTAATSSNWTDSVMRSLTMREKAAQIVWPSVYGDYVSGDSPQWRRLTQYVEQEKVGGFTISVGSPTEVAAKLNALQAMSKSTEYEDDGVDFDIASGDAYVDMKDVIESELRRIRAERVNRATSRASGSPIRNNDKDRNVNGGQTS